jgi:guanine deaminase
MATLGGAISLDCEADIGNFKIGKEADFIVLDPESTPIMRYRKQHCDSLQEMLFGIALLGDDRAVSATYAIGQCVHRRDSDEKV